MKKGIAGLLVLAMMLSVLISTAAASKQYTDVSDDSWYAPYVTYVSDRGIFQGVKANTFEPNTLMTRAMFVTVLFRISDAKAPVKAAAFRDVPRGSWYADAVAWGADTGVVRGYSKDQFGPNDPVTREQMCTLLVRFSKLTGTELQKNQAKQSFTDAGTISGYAKDAVSDCQRAGLVQGVGNGMFAPKKNATRAEVAAILTRYLQQSPEVPTETPGNHAELPIDILP